MENLGIFILATSEMLRVKFNSKPPSWFAFKNLKQIYETFIFFLNTPRQVPRSL